MDFEAYCKKLKMKSDEELIETFNGEVGKPGWTSSRANFLSAIRSEFNRRKFDYSAIGDESSMSYKNKITLTEGGVIEIRK